LAGAVYAPCCAVCGKRAAEAPVCGECLRGIDLLCRSVTVPIHEHCDSVWAFAAYDGVWLDVIHKLKYEKATAVISAVSWLVRRHLPPFGGSDCIVPVPLGRLRYLRRGFNQAAVIGRVVSEAAALPLFRRALAKPRNTPSQVGLTYDERKENIRGAFAAPRLLRDSVKGKSVLLIDDVVTSGATVSECARVLKKTGAGRVDVLTLAKTL
jgi:ComF family protein